MNYDYTATDDDYNLISYFTISTNSSTGNYLLRLTHPDYQTVVRNVEIEGGSQTVDPIKLRKLSSYERAVMLRELTVKASVVQFVNRGDTLSYNADAFDLAQGSMLDALIRELPGVELREGGQIYVNNRFVNRLLLDGKDFFVGDKLVLLQNLPAYTVKRINVYEQVRGANEILGKESADMHDSYVMDVVLKKGFNNGWIANAEVGGGSHQRYKIRAFSAAYTPNIRLGAYAFANNVNETGTPGSTGDWDTSPSSNGRITSQGGGIDYLYSKKDNSLELNGTAVVRHSKSIFNEYLGIQNFLPAGDTYGRQWSSRNLRDISLNTHHSLNLRPAQGAKYLATFEFDLLYNHTDDSNESREGTFSTDISPSGLYDRLLEGFSPDEGLINRYLPTSMLRSNPLKLKLQLDLGRSLGKRVVGIFANGFATYGHSSDEANDRYLLQYGMESSKHHSRLNPRRSHYYEAELNPSITIKLADGLTLSPQVNVNYRYTFNCNDWFSYDSGESLSSEIIQRAAMAYDMQNSFWSNSSRTGEIFSLPLTYFKQFYRNSQTNSQIYVSVKPGIQFVQHKLNYYGEKPQHLARNYTSPRCQLGINAYLPGMSQQLALDYTVSGADFDMMNLVDRSYSSDPLFVYIGARNLHTGTNHELSLRYNSMSQLFDRLSFTSKILYRVEDDKVIMSSAYDKSTGVRTYRPANADGVNRFSVNIWTQVYLDRPKRFWMDNDFTFINSHNVDLISDDGFATMQRNSLHGVGFVNSTRIGYSHSGYALMARFGLNTLNVRSSRNNFFFDRYTMLVFGVSGRARLPWGFEISSSLMKHLNRGFDSRTMDTDPLVWNVRMSKSLFKGRLILAVDGFDILSQINNITYRINAQSRTDSWTNSLPSYVLFTVRWSFAKKPRE